MHQSHGALKNNLKNVLLGILLLLTHDTIYVFSQGAFEVAPSGQPSDDASGYANSTYEATSGYHSTDQEPIQHSSLEINQLHQVHSQQDTIDQITQAKRQLEEQQTGKYEKLQTDISKQQELIQKMKDIQAQSAILTQKQQEDYKEARQMEQTLRQQIAHEQQLLNIEQQRENILAQQIRQQEYFQRQQAQQAEQAKQREEHMRQQQIEQNNRIREFMENQRRQQEEQMSRIRQQQEDQQRAQMLRQQQQADEQQRRRDEQSRSYSVRQLDSQPPKQPETQQLQQHQIQQQAQTQQQQSQQQTQEQQQLGDTSPQYNLGQGDIQQGNFPQDHPSVTVPGDVGEAPVPQTQQVPSQNAAIPQYDLQPNVMKINQPGSEQHSVHQVDTVHSQDTNTDMNQQQNVAGIQSVPRFSANNEQQDVNGEKLVFPYPDMNPHSAMQTVPEYSNTDGAAQTISQYPAEQSAAVQPIPQYSAEHQQSATVVVQSIPQYPAINPQPDNSAANVVLQYPSTNQQPANFVERTVLQHPLSEPGPESKPITMEQADKVPSIRSQTPYEEQLQKRAELRDKKVQYKIVMQTVASQLNPNQPKAPIIDLTKFVGNSH